MRVLHTAPARGAYGLSIRRMMMSGHYAASTWILESVGGTLATGGGVAGDESVQGDNGTSGESGSLERGHNVKFGYSGC